MMRGGAALAITPARPRFPRGPMQGLQWAHRIWHAREDIAGILDALAGWLSRSWRGVAWAGSR